MSVIKRAEGVYQRGKDPRVLTLVFNGPPKDGKSRNQLSVRFVGSLSDAKIERGRLVAEASSGNSVAQTKMTVGQLVAEWLSLYAEQNLEPNSYQAAEWIARVHINNKDHGIGHIQADELTARQLDRFYKTLRSSGRIDGKGGLGSRSVQHIHDILRQVLRWAVKKGDLRTNIALNADPPKVQQRTVKPMGESRTCELIEATRGTTSYVPVMLAIFTGCRQGEIAALKWCDVDLDEGRISVNRSLQQVPKDFAEKLSSVSGDLRGKLSEMEDGCREKLPKNGKSRAIPICQTLITELRRVKGQQAEVRLAIGSDYNSEGWVCIEIGRAHV